MDLHAHTTASDGTAAPEDLVALARARGLAAVAVTDHDTLAALPAARAAAAGTGVEVVPGVELSVDAARGQLHLLGYYVDATDDRFLQVIAAPRAARGPRNASIVERLRALGVDVTLADVETEAARGASGRASERSVGRPHIASALVRKGVVASVQEAFDRYLGEGKPAHVPKTKLTPADAVRAVRAAGGVPVLAHPFSLPAEDRRGVITDLKRLGLEGVEVIYPKHDAKLREELTALAREFDLAVTGGSDYHGANKPDIDLGTGRNGNTRVPYSCLEAVRERKPR